MKTCGGKKRWRYKADAIRALHRFQSKSTRQRIQKRAYPCPHCKGYHLTSKEAR